MGQSTVVIARSSTRGYMVSDRTSTRKERILWYVPIGICNRTWTCSQRGDLTEQIPWLETPIIYDVRAKPRNIASLTGTKDLQMVSLRFYAGLPPAYLPLTQQVNITCRVLSRPSQSDLPAM